MAQNQYLLELFRKYMANQCSPEEVDILFELLDNEENKELKSQLIQSQLKNSNPTGYSDPLLKEKLEQRLNQIMMKIDKPENERTKIRSIRSKWLAAAAVLILIAGAGYLFINNAQSSE